MINRDNEKRKFTCTWFRIDSFFYRALFPPVYNSELEKDIFLREEVVKSAFNKDITVPVEVFYEAIEGSGDSDFFVTNYFMVELIDDIVAH